MRTILICTLLALPLVAQAPEGKKDENDKRWHAAAESVANGYRAWPRVEDEARWAPFLCRMPNPAPARFSKAKKDTPHARKLYTLYAKDPVKYGAHRSFVGNPPNDVQRKALERLATFDQIIVKEAWAPEKMVEKPTAHPWGKDGNWGKSGLRPTKRGDDWYRADKRAGLFVMLHLADAANKKDMTDAGWVYATLDTKGTVTGAGRMQSCMSCHTKRPNRLFGLPNDSHAKVKKKKTKE